MQHSDPSAHNEQQWQALAQHLDTQPPQAHLILIQTESFDSRDRWIETCTAHAPQFQHIGLNLSQEQVSSLADILHSRFADLLDVSEEIQIQQVVHILHLETSFLQEIVDGASILLPHLEKEADELMSDMPIICLFWTDAYTSTRIEQEAPEFWKRISTKIFFLPEEDEVSTLSSPYETLTQLSQQIQEEGQTGDMKHKQLLEIGDVFGRYGRSEGARAWYDKALESAGEEADEASQILAYERIADLLVEDQDLGTALGWYEQSLELLEGKDQEEEEMGHLHQKIGAVFLRLRNHKKALPHLRQAAQAFETIDAAQPLGETYKQIAKAYEYKGEPTATVEAYEAAIEAFASLGAEGAKDLALSYQQIGFIHQGRHNWIESLDAFRLALPHAQQAEDDFLISALEDSIENLEEKTQEKKRGVSADKGKKKGWLGKLFG